MVPIQNIYTIVITGSISATRMADQCNGTYAVETHVDAKGSLGIDPGPLQELNSLTNQVLTTQKLTEAKTHRATRLARILYHQQ
jgi:hypothetical protein